MPGFDEATWDFTVWGATADGEQLAGTGRASAAAAHRGHADFHCVTKFSVLDNTWTGVPTSVLLEQVPPAPAVTHVMVWAEYGYSANLRLADFADASALLVTHRDGEPLRPTTARRCAWSCRTCTPGRARSGRAAWSTSIEDRRGFWEERGYHNRADPWQEQRYSYQERPGDGGAGRRPRRL